MPSLWGNLLQASPDIPLQSVLRSSSQQAEEINHLTNYFFIAAAFILLVVAVLTFLALYKFSENKNNTPSKPLSKKWEFLTIGVPSLLVAVFLYLNIKTINKVEPAHGNTKPDVIITAHQWWWEATYPTSRVVTANEIHLPAGKQILLKLLSADVVHDWWIPQFGNKMDMVPGQENFLYVNIKQPGEYFGTCSEFCGAQHAHMRLKIIAQNETDYNNWLLQRQQPSTNVAFASGAQLFMQKTCGNCHRINGTTAQGTIGPDLTHIASRKTLLAGLLENNIENLTNWIRDPQQIKPGAYMPDFHLDDTTVKSISLYLSSLK
jgi:cytochrome c oxidase subunit II